MEFDKVDIRIAKQQGNVGVARAVYEYTKNGYTVLLPISDSDAYDLVIDTGRALLRVQVKTSRALVKNKYVINLSTKGGNTKINTVRPRQELDYDVLFCLTSSGDCWSIPVNALGGAKHGIVISSAKYDQFRL